MSGAIKMDTCAQLFNPQETLRRPNLSSPQEHTLNIECDENVGAAAHLCKEIDNSCEHQKTSAMPLSVLVLKHTQRKTSWNIMASFCNFWSDWGQFFHFQKQFSFFPAAM